MVQRGRGLGFAHKTDSCLGIYLHLFREEFNRNLAVEHCILSQIDFPHSSLADLFKDFVVLDFVSGSNHLFYEWRISFEGGK